MSETLTKQPSHKLDNKEAYRLTVESIYKRIRETAFKGRFELYVFGLPESVITELEDNGFIVSKDRAFGDTTFKIKWK